MRKQIRERAAEVRKGGDLGVFADEKVTTEVSVCCTIHAAMTFILGALQERQ